MSDQSAEEKHPWTYTEPIGITKEQWMAILEDEDIVTEKDRELLKLMYGGEWFRAPKLAELLQISYYGLINLQAGHLGKRVAEKLGIPVPEWRWRVLFWGKGEEGFFYWSLRPELRDAMSELELKYTLSQNAESNFQGKKASLTDGELYPGVVSNPEIMGGMPVIKGTRIPVALVLGKLAGGISVEEVIHEFYLDDEAILVALGYAAQHLAEENISARNK